MATGIASTFNNPILIAAGKYITTRSRIMGHNATGLTFRYQAPTCIDGPSCYSAIGETVGENKYKRGLILGSVFGD
jgi:hypothetical protein